MLIQDKLLFRNPMYETEHYTLTEKRTVEGIEKTTFAYIDDCRKEVGEIRDFNLRSIYRVGTLPIA